MVRLPNAGCGNWRLVGLMRWAGGAAAASVADRWCSKPAVAGIFGGNRVAVACPEHAVDVIRRKP